MPTTIESTPYTTPEEFKKNLIKNRKFNRYISSTKFTHISKIRTKDYRLLIKKLMGNQCVECKSDHNLKLHHREYNPNPREISDIILICSSCHTKTHNKLRKDGIKLSVNIAQ